MAEAAEAEAAMAAEAEALAQVAAEEAADANIPESLYHYYL